MMMGPFIILISLLFTNCAANCDTFTNVDFDLVTRFGKFN